MLNTTRAEIEQDLPVHLTRASKIKTAFMSAFLFFYAQKEEEEEESCMKRLFLPISCKRHIPATADLLLIKCESEDFLFWKEEGEEEKERGKLGVDRRA